MSDWTTYTAVHKTLMGSMRRMKATDFLEHVLLHLLMKVIWYESVLVEH